MNEVIKKFASIKQWEDNPTNFQILEYHETIKEATEYIKKQPKDTGQYRSKFNYDIMVYDI